MAVIPSDIKIFLSQGNPEDNSTTTGGRIADAADHALKASFKDLSAADTVQIVSASGVDAAPIVIKGRDAGGAIVTETEVLNGTVPATTTQTFERLLSCLKSATTAGDVAIERTTKTRQNELYGAALKTSTVMAYATLDGSASSSNDAYNNFVLRIDNGIGSGQIREILDYDGSTKRAYVNRDWDVLPVSGDSYVLAEGAVLDASPISVSGVRRLFYDATANAAGGTDLAFFERLNVRNCHSTLTLTNAKIQLTFDGTADDIITIALESGLQLDTSVANRLTAPDTNDTPWGTGLLSVPGGNLAAGSWIGIWVSGSYDAGLAPEKAEFRITATGSST